MVMQCVEWIRRSWSIWIPRFWRVSARYFGIVAVVYVAFMEAACANLGEASVGTGDVKAVEESCIEIKASSLTYTNADASPLSIDAPQWALAITYTHQNGLNQSRALTPTVTAHIDNESDSLPVISRRDSPTDGQYDLYVDVQHQELFEPSDENEAARLAGAVDTLWRQLKHVALDAAMPNDTKPVFSCNCICPAIDGVKIEPRQLMSSPDPGAEPAAAFEAMFKCIRLGSVSGQPFQAWQVGYEKPDWRIVVVGQAEFLDDLAKSNVSLDDLAGRLNARYHKLIPPYPGKVLIILFDPRNASDQPVISDAHLSRLAATMKKRLSRPQAGIPEILIFDYRDETLVDKLAPPIETVLTVGLPELFSKTTLTSSHFTVTAPSCATPAIIEGKDVMTMYAAPHLGDAVDLWKELLLFFLMLVTVVGSWTLLLSTVAYRGNWFRIREKLELAFIFPWYEPIKKVPQPSDGASSHAKDN